MPNSISGTLFPNAVWKMSETTETFPAAFLTTFAERLLPCPLPVSLFPTADWKKLTYRRVYRELSQHRQNIPTPLPPQSARRSLGVSDPAATSQYLRLVHRRMFAQTLEYCRYQIRPARRRTGSNEGFDALVHPLQIQIPQFFRHLKRLIIASKIFILLLPARIIPFP